MAWQWSHSAEAYENARQNLESMERETLEVIFAEWKATQGKCGIIGPYSEDFSERNYNLALKLAETLPGDVLIDFIWEKAVELATCENGGADAWMCPYGCGSHFVPFDYIEGDSDED